MSKKHVFILVCILALAAFFRFYQLTVIPPGLYPDEAMNGNNVVEAIKTGTYKIFYPENNGREGLFINLQSISVRLFGTEPWALRGVSALVGLLTVWGLYLLTRELFWQEHTARRERIALVAAFFLATSFWHILFSRIGFRAIMTPFFLVWGFYFLYKMIRVLHERSAVSYIAEGMALAAGIFFGLGFHTYIAYRVAPALLISPLAKGWREYRQGLLVKCFPCLFTLFLFFAFIAALPIGYYFLTHPADFLGRTSQVSVFASEQPLTAIGKNIALTVGMLFWHGDWNWRHNFAGAPELWWPLGIFFLIGMYASLRILFKNMRGASASSELFLFIWLAVLSIPSIISNEGLPHALRSIGLIPPIMILAALGFDRMLNAVYAWVEKRRMAFPESAEQLARIRRELIILLGTILIAIAIHAFTQYFFRWGANHNVASAFNERYIAIGRYIRTLPNSEPIYVIVNAGGVDVRGIPISAQPIMFMLGEGIISQGETTARGVRYILPDELSVLVQETSTVQKIHVVTLEQDVELNKRIREILPRIRFEKAPQDIIVGIAE